LAYLCARTTIRLSAVDFVGMARSLAVEPDLPSRLLQGLGPRYQLSVRKTGIKFLDRMSFLEIAWYARQLRRIAHGQEPKANESALSTFLAYLVQGGWRLLRTRQLRGLYV
jgi:hypothetical protein